MEFSDMPEPCSKKIGRTVSLIVPLHSGMMQLVTDFAEGSSRNFGLMKDKCLSLRLVSEEVFAFLTGYSSFKGEIQIVCTDRCFCVEIAFHLKRGMLPLEAFNLTRTASTEGEQMGLILAARMADRLSVDDIGTEKFALRFEIDRLYPDPEKIAMPPLEGGFEVADADAAALKEFSARMPDHYADSTEPFLGMPGKLIDMVASGEYGALVLKNGKGQVGGGIFFSRGRHVSEAHGTFVFSDEPSLPRLLVEGMLERTGRHTDTLCVAIMEPTAQTPVLYFDRLDGNALYRQISEDNGAMVFTDKALRKFLSDFYMRLALPRILQDIKYMGEELADNSAIATSIDRQKRRASLNLLWPGKNFAENLNMHLELLAKQDIGDIRFSSELESPEEAILTPVLLAAGFTPSMVLPWGGRKGDIAIFRHEGK